MRRLALVALALATVAMTPPSVDAQHREAPPTYQDLPQAIPLPMLPYFQGNRTKFIYGQRSDFADKSSNYIIVLDYMEDKDQVLQWYEAALKSGMWTMNKGEPGRRVSARRPKEGYNVLVTVQPPSSGSPYKSGCRITYGMYKPVEDSGDDNPFGNQQTQRPGQQQQQQQQHR